MGYNPPSFPSSATGYRHGWRRDPATLPHVTDANFKGVDWTPLAWVSLVKDSPMTVGEEVVVDVLLLCGAPDPSKAPRWRLASWEGCLDGCTDRPSALGAYTDLRWDARSHLRGADRVAPEPRCALGAGRARRRLRPRLGRGLPGAPGGGLTPFS